MKTRVGKYFQKTTAVLLAAIMMLSVFAVLPADLFKVSAATEVSFDDRMELDFNNNWKFHLGNEADAYLKAFDDSTWETVELPHDFSISQDFYTNGTEIESGSLPGGTGWYRKAFVMPATCKDKSVILNFDGSYKDTYVYVNGELVGENHYGYNSFSFDITDYLICNNQDVNFIAVKVEHQLYSSRWYSGSGIYRDVTMTIVDPVHVDLYGTYVTTPNLESSSGADGTVNATVSIDNDNSYVKTVNVTAQILDPSGNAVGTSATADVTALAGVATDVTLTPKVDNPLLWNSWDMGDPNLYTLRVTVSEDGTVIDTYDTEFGFRWFNWGTTNGFSLNGQNLKIEGVCMHHDQGALGAVQEYDSIYRQVAILKDMGCNAIRTSHGTPSRVFMEVCNELGMLVMNEFFDGWSAYKNSNSNDFGAYFNQTINTSTNKVLNATNGQEWYKFVLTQSVKRDRNDPAVVIWDIGNELLESATGDTSGYDGIAQTMKTMLTTLDPTRPVCHGSNRPYDDEMVAVDAIMDVVGGNYNTSSWISIMQDTSDSRSSKPYIGTETASAISSRGVYDTLSQYNYVCSGYDTYAVNWGQKAAAAWYNTILYDWNSGEFVWTGFDYIGEPTPWNNPQGSASAGYPVSSYFGIVDTAGFAKDTYYLYRSMWNEHSNTLHLVPGTWDSSVLVKNGNYAYVAVYSNADKIELYGDGSLIASATAVTTTSDAGHSYQTWTETSNNSNVNTTEFYTGDGNDLYPQFQVNYSAYSTISVKAYELTGTDTYTEITDTVGTKSISNATATKIVASTWNGKAEYTADGDSYVYVELEAQDANGNFDSTYNGTVNVTLSGNSAQIVGVDNGDSSSSDRFQQSTVSTSDTTATVQMFNGKAIAVLRTNEVVDDQIEVVIEPADSLDVVNNVSAVSMAETGAELIDEFEEVTDQSNLVYEPTTYDKYNALKAQLDAIDGGEVDYTYYQANPEGTTAVNLNVPDGWYIVAGADDQGGNITSGVMTNTTHSSGGLTADGTTGVPAETSDTWYFERQDTGLYHIYYEDDNGTKQYLTISNNQVYVSETAYALEVTADASGNVHIGFGTSYINFSGATSGQVWQYTTPTDLALYYVDTSGDSSANVTTTKSLEQLTVDSTLLDDGWYVLYGSAGDITVGSITHTAHTDSTGGLTTTGTSGTPEATADAWYFEKQSDGTYYVYYTDDSGVNHYMNISSSNYGLSVSTTAQALTVAASSGGITIGANGQYVNFCGNSYHGNHAITWSSASIVTVYKVVETTTNPTTTTVTQVTSFTTLDGDYIITGQDNYTGTFAYGAMTHSATSDGAGFLPKNETFSTDNEVDADTVWTIEPATGGYYVYYTDSNGAKQYITMNSSGATTTTTATLLTINGNSTVTIGASDNDYKLNYFGSEQKVGVWTDGTSLTLYKVETVTTSSGNVYKWIPSSEAQVVPPVEDGEYVIYDGSYIMSGETSDVGLGQVAETPSNNIITTNPVYDWKFTLVDGTTNQYYIQNSEDKYLSIGSSAGSISLSDTAVALTVTGQSNYDIIVVANGQALDHYVNEGGFNTWSSSASDNQKMTLYRKESGVTDIAANKQDLYAALQEGIQYAPGTYTVDTYQKLFDALEAGYAVLEDDAATDEQITNATTAINEAIDGLTIEKKTFPATLYKYGYNPDSTDSKYTNGAAFNEQTYASMKAIIEADDNLVAQIKTAIDYDGTNGTTWLDGEADTALDTAITAYAEIYSLAFTGVGVTGATAVDNFQKTAWNVWCKSDTQGAEDTMDEGASVQGLFSALLVDGRPADHADYTSALPYGNIIDDANRVSFNTEAGVSLTITANGESTTITSLPALQGISVHINDLFEKVDVAANDTTAGYSKYYWDLDMPFITTTNEYGINTYTYSSSSSEYVFQAEFDDANHKATAQLTPVDSWSVNRDSKGAGTGFFPFNNQLGATTFTGENAIYHYGFNFATDFYIPVTGTYADGEDVVFNFSGDDDVLVYIDGVLVLDNGGLHGARLASINFTDATISYQYAMDVTEGTVESTTENAVTYAYGAANTTANADELAALEKLNEVRTDGDYHTFSFYYLERGSTDSNCEISLNLQQASEHVLLHDQTIVIDYGLPVEDYNTNDDDFISDSATAAGTTVEYLGILNANTDVNNIVTFSEPTLADTFEASGDTLDIQGFKYGTGNITKTGIVSYTPNTVNMTGRDFFYACAKIENDPTYSAGTVYYQYEKTTYIPATSIYFEDNFGAELTFNNGTNTAGTDHGKWQTVGDASQFADAKQAADLAENSAANPYGYDPAYDNCSEYSGYSAQMVTVNASNNTKNGGTNPTFEFEFTGTGFDVISITDNTTGVFYVEIFDENGTRVGKRRIVDTYYGYSYGQLYADENGEATLTVTDKPFYKSEKELVTTSVKYYTVDGTTVSNTVTYYDVSGVGYTETPTYYDADGNLTTTETENPAYAYAYAFGWVESNDTVEGLYQIPVIKINGLDYGKYTVIVTPMYTAMFDHNGTGEFNLYVDAIRIYDPAGKDDGVDSAILPDYKYDNESYPSYLELKEVLIGADSLSKDETTQGVVFIDGIAALNNDLEKYKVAGPNNELYLAAGQAVAFEIWASAVPDEVQLGVKSAKGNPILGVAYNGGSTITKAINTATEMNYIINDILPTDGKLTWTMVTVDGVTYYKTNTLVIQNTATDNSILSITSMKWTFTGVGQFGHYETSVPETAEVSLMATGETVNDAYAMLKYIEDDAGNDTENDDTNTGDDVVTPETPEVSDEPAKDDAVNDDVANDNVADDNTSTGDNADENDNSAQNDTPNKVVVNEPITVTVTTSTGVTELIIRDEDGNVITPENLEYEIEKIGDKEAKVWKITLAETESGTYTYSVVGEFADGTVEEEDDFTITVVAPEEDLSFFERLAGLFENLVDFFKKLIASIGND